MTQEIGEVQPNLEPAQPVPPDITDRGSERFPWKGLLLSLGLASVGFTVALGVGEMISPGVIPYSSIKALGVSFGLVSGFMGGLFITQKFNLFRENVTGWDGKLYPKSPS